MVRVPGGRSRDRPSGRGEPISYAQCRSGIQDPNGERVIGLPGDSIEIRNKRVLLDGTELDEPYADYAEGMVGKMLTPRDNLGPVTVPAGTYFVLGDSRDRSYDSRFWGPVAGDAIRGRVHIIYWSWSSEEHAVRWERLGRVVR
jgi:signal peptidase I